MPKTMLSGSSGLAIQLDNYNVSYNPGDTIIGRINRKEHTVSTRAWVTIRLHGRTKSKLTIQSGNNSTTHYRGRFNLFAPNGISQKLFDGPVHIPPNADLQIWPFAVTIPTSPSPHAVKSGNTQDLSFVPLNDEAIATSSLPSSFSFEHSKHSTRLSSFVEYYLEAEFRQENKFGLTTATFPITLVEIPSPYPFDNFELKSHTSYGYIKTQRLVPSMGDAKLTFHQKAQKLLGSTKVPELHFSVKVDYPTVIQMQNPSPISFKISIIGNRKRTSDIIEEVPQTLTITSLSMKLKSTTAIKCTATFTPRTASGTGEHVFAPLAGKETILGLRIEPITLSSEPDAKEIDLGAFLELRLFPQRAYVKGKPLSVFGRIYPSFVTYNIRHTHQLKWAFTLEAAGERLKVHGQYPVSILAASSES